jgi:hypothetical protein
MRLLNDNQHPQRIILPQHNVFNGCTWSDNHCMDLAFDPVTLITIPCAALYFHKTLNKKVMPWLANDQNVIDLSFLR